MTEKEQLAFYYRLLRQHGLNDSHSGNGSIRVKDNYLVTKTGACADTIQADELIECTLDQTPTAGASLDASIHQRIYQQLGDRFAVLHAHNPYTIALTLKGGDFSPIDFEGQHYFSNLKVIECDAKQYLDVMPDRIADCLAKQPVAIVRSHGVYAAAHNLDLAYKWLSSLEQSSKIKWLAQQI